MRPNTHQLTRETAALMADAYLRTVSAYPGGHAGRGIVICAGGVRYNSCAWVTIRMLRRLGCELPIEVWYRGADERDPGWIKLVESLGVRCIDALEVRERHPHPRLNGWELKPYAILHSVFREVLFLDADNVPVQDPTFVFDQPEYAAKGAIFWPDPPHIRTPRQSERWQVFGVPFRDEPEVESGQLVIDKARCWRALNLCNWYNEHSDFYYQIVYGDKDTFRFAWHRCGLEYAMTEHALLEIPHTLCQKDFRGNRLFQHRFNAKWSVCENLAIPGFWREEECLGFLAELRAKWSPVDGLSRRAAAEDRRQMSALTGQTLRLVIHGTAHWPIELDARGYVGQGRSWARSYWWVENGALVFADGNGAVTCRLPEVGAAVWEGEMGKRSHVTASVIASAEQREVAV